MSTTPQSENVVALEEEELSQQDMVALAQASEEDGNHHPPCRTTTTGPSPPAHHHDDDAAVVGGDARDDDDDEPAASYRGGTNTNSDDLPKIHSLVVLPVGGKNEYQTRTDDDDDDKDDHYHNDNDDDDEEDNNDVVDDDSSACSLDLAPGENWLRLTVRDAMVNQVMMLEAAGESDATAATGTTEEQESQQQHQQQQEMSEPPITQQTPAELQTQQLTQQLTQQPDQAEPNATQQNQHQRRPRRQQRNRRGQVSSFFPSILSLSDLGGAMVANVPSPDCFLCFDVDHHVLAVKDFRPVEQMTRPPPNSSSRSTTGPPEQQQEEDDDDINDNDHDDQERVNQDEAPKVFLARKGRSTLWLPSTLESLPRRELRILRPGDRVLISRPSPNRHGRNSVVNSGGIGGCQTNSASSPTNNQRRYDRNQNQRGLLLEYRYELAIHTTTTTTASIASVPATQSSIQEVLVAEDELCKGRSAAAEATSPSVGPFSHGVEDYPEGTLTQPTILSPAAAAAENGPTAQPKIPKPLFVLSTTASQEESSVRAGNQTSDNGPSQQSTAPDQAGAAAVLLTQPVSGTTELGANETAASAAAAVAGSRDRDNDVNDSDGAVNASNSNAAEVLAPVPDGSTPETDGEYDAAHQTKTTTSDGSHHNAKQAARRVEDISRPTEILGDAEMSAADLSQSLYAETQVAVPQKEAATSATTTTTTASKERRSPPHSHDVHDDNADEQSLVLLSPDLSCTPITTPGQRRDLTKASSQPPLQSSKRGSNAAAPMRDSVKEKDGVASGNQQYQVDEPGHDSDSSTDVDTTLHVPPNRANEAHLPEIDMSEPAQIASSPYAIRASETLLRLLTSAEVATTPAPQKDTPVRHDRAGSSQQQQGKPETKGRKRARAISQAANPPSGNEVHLSMTPAPVSRPRRKKKSPEGSSMGTGLSTDETTAAADSVVTTRSASKKSKRSRRTQDDDDNNNNNNNNNTNDAESEIRVVATGIELTNKELQKMIKKIGGELVEELEKAHTATHVIASDGMKPIRRTPKLMIAMCSTWRIVRLDWLIQSAEARRALPEDKFLILDDRKAERDYGFSMTASVAVIKSNVTNRTRMLEGWSVFVAPGVVAPGKKNQAPPMDVFRLMVQAAGGSWIPSLSTEPADAMMLLVVVASKSDKRKFERRRATFALTDKEFFTTFLKQKLEIQPEVQL